MGSVIRRKVFLLIVVALVASIYLGAVSANEYVFAASKIKQVDKLLHVSPTPYNNDIAYVAADLALATYSADDGCSSEAIDNLLYSAGFKEEDIHSESYGGARAFTVAVKDYKGKDSTGDTRLLIIAAQGSTIGSHLLEEFIADSTAWADRPFRNHISYDYMYDFCYKILGKVKEVVEPGKQYKVLITGHSLGGAAANLVAAQIEDEINTKQDDVFCYTFGAINAIFSDEPVEDGYSNIHNIYNDLDTFAPEQLGDIMVTGAGGKYGKFGHLDSYIKDHRDTGKMNHDMDLYRDDVKKGVVKKSILRRCSSSYNPPQTIQFGDIFCENDRITVNWEKDNQRILKGSKVGYELQYSSRPFFETDVHTKKYYSYKTTKRTILGLKSNSEYYFRIRTFIKYRGTQYYSDWTQISAKTLPMFTSGYNTPDRCVYTCGVELGQYMYMISDDELLKINLKKTGSKAISRIYKSQDSIEWLSYRDGYLYFTDWAFDDTPQSPGGLYRMNLETEEYEKISDTEYYMISGDTIHLATLISEGSDDFIMYYTCNLDGSSRQYIGKYEWENDPVNTDRDSFNVKGYREKWEYGRNYITYYLITPSGRKYKLDRFRYF